GNDRGNGFGKRHDRIRGIDRAASAAPGIRRGPPAAAACLRDRRGRFHGRGRPGGANGNRAGGTSGGRHYGTLRRPIFHLSAAARGPNHHRRRVNNFESAKTVLSARAIRAGYGGGSDVL